MDDPVQAQLDAYNARDLEAFLHCYSPDVVVTNSDGVAMITGHEAMRSQYGVVFSRPGVLHADVPRRVHAGTWTVDEEHVVMGEHRVEALVAYQVLDGLITRVVMLH